MTTGTNGDDAPRINKFLAATLGISRRAADELISKQAVEVDGRKIRLGERYRGGKLSLNGRPLAVTQPKFIYLIMHKPAGYVCSKKSQGGSRTIYGLLPKELRHLKTVGRLDKMSTGLILLTNDGDFAYRYTHPSFSKTKIYLVSLDKPLAPLHRQMIMEHGISLGDGISRFDIERVGENDDLNWRVVMHEGRNRQIRRTFGTLGYEVLALHRTNFGNYTLDDMKPGEYRQIDIA